MSLTGCSLKVVNKQQQQKQQQNEAKQIKLINKIVVTNR